MGVGRYSLIVLNKDNNQEIVVPVKELNAKTNQIEYKSKVHISTIDYGTSQFENAQQLINYFYKQGLIDFTNAEIYITYKISEPQKTTENGNIQKRPIIYRDNTSLVEIVKKIHQKNPYVDTIPEFLINKTITFIIAKMRDGILYRYLTRDNYFVNRYVAFDLDDILYKQYEEIEYKEIMEILQKKLSSYKTTRDILYGIYSFESPNKLDLSEMFPSNYFDPLQENPKLDDLKSPDYFEIDFDPNKQYESTDERYTPSIEQHPHYERYITYKTNYDEEGVHYGHQKKLVPPTGFQVPNLTPDESDLQLPL